MSQKGEMMERIKKIGTLLLALALIAGLATEPVMDVNAAAKVAISGTKSITQGQTGKVTVKNLVVAYIDAEKNLIGLKGAVPGPRKGIVSLEGKE